MVEVKYSGKPPAERLAHRLKNSGGDLPADVRVKHGDAHVEFFTTCITAAIKAALAIARTALTMAATETSDEHPQRRNNRHRRSRKYGRHHPERQRRCARDRGPRLSRRCKAKLADRPPWRSTSDFGTGTGRQWMAIGDPAIATAGTGPDRTHGQRSATARTRTQAQARRRTAKGSVMARRWHR
jgi:hypothetical protein